MPKIIQLSPHVANLIAAGEVVERPASVVKELLENAVDAGAKNVRVEIENGGMALIRVTDDGCGMLPEDAETAFLRHATSKIRAAEDLSAIHTMGFRGEALAAIASVSHIDLLTRPEAELEGTSLHLDAGVITERMPAGCPAGTTVFVRNLFYNTPARMKFMKRDSVEASSVQAAVQNQALAHPDVAISLVRDGTPVFSTPGDGELRSVIYQLLGRQTALEMAEVSGTWDGCRLSGFVSTPANTRGTRGGQFFFVNGRPVKSRLLMAALEQAYQNQLLPGRFPSCVLHLSVPEDAVDVNVHPAKTEVKFLAERSAFDCVHYGVRSALENVTARPAMHLAPQKSAAAQVQTAKARTQAGQQQDFYKKMTPEQFRAFSNTLEQGRAVQATPAQAKAVLHSVETDLPQHRVADWAASKKAAPQPPTPAPKQVFVPTETVKPVVTPAPAAEPAPKHVPEPAPQEPEQEQAALPLPEAPDWRLVGEVLDTYLIVEQDGQVLFIDKHAAHERILFEKLRAQPHEVVSQTLLLPTVATLTPQEAAAALTNLDLLSTLGFSLSDAGDGAVLIRAVPADLDAQDAGAVLSALCQDLLEGKALDPEARRDRMLHTVACKAAIKGGWKTSETELAHIAREVLTRDDLRYCPHGRPICIALTRAQLERQFKRA